MLPLLRVVVLAVVLTPLTGCAFALIHGAKEFIATTQKNRKAEVDLALIRFSDLLQQAEYDQTARMFTSDGEVVLESREPAVGRAAISSLLASTFAARPVAYALHASETSDQGEQVTQQGSYSRTTIEAGGRPFVLRGSFSAVWVHDPDGKWYLRRLRTLAGPAGSAT